VQLSLAAALFVRYTTRFYFLSNANGGSMRQRASIITTMEGISRPVYRIARELSQNSRSGLTVRFLSKKLELPQEEIEYLVDVNHKLLYTDLTKIKLPAEGVNAVKRISDGLENLGDVPALFRKIKSHSVHDFRLLEEQLGLTAVGTKKGVAQYIVDSFYKHPDSVVEYVASHGFSPVAREVFDVVWNSKEGILPAARIRSLHGGSEFEVEQALWELFRGAALFEMFRFDTEERVIRMGGLLAEIRQCRDSQSKSQKKKPVLKGLKSAPGHALSRGLDMTDAICHLIAAIAAKPARVRSDGELFREDLRRLSDTVDEEQEPSLSTCLWAAEGVGWLARVDNELHAPDLEELIDVEHFQRHKLLFEWMMSTGNEGTSRRVLADALEGMKSGTWYPTLAFAKFVMHARDEQERSVLKSQGAHFAYVSPGWASNSDKSLVRSLDEMLFWLGAVEKCIDGDEAYFRITDIGRCILEGKGDEALNKRFSKTGREIVVQPNFDIVVPTQDMDPLLTVPLDQFTMRQSTGKATVYLLTKESFTQGLQDGHDGEAFVEYLITHNRGGTLPANVMMTLEDWRGGLRRVHLRTIQVLETDDPLVMADLQHRRKYQKFFKEVDPHRIMTYQKVTKADLTKQLEKDGFIVE